MSINPENGQKVTPEQIIRIYAQEGQVITNDQVIKILEFLYMLADIALDIGGRNQRIFTLFLKFKRDEHPPRGSVAYEMFTKRTKLDILISFKQFAYQLLVIHAPQK